MWGAEGASHDRIPDSRCMAVLPLRWHEILPADARAAGEIGAASMKALPHLPKCGLCNFHVRGNWEEHRQACLAIRRERSRIWRRNNPEKWAAAQRRARRVQRPRYLANKKLQWAISTGKITKPDCCENCKTVTPPRRLQGHHEDYTKPLEVIWLCDSCHKARHRATA